MNQATRSHPPAPRIARCARALIACIPWIVPAFPTPASAQNLIWENQGMTNAFGIDSGRTFNYNGAQVTLTWSVTTNGGDTIIPAYGSNYVSYQAGMEGGHIGHVLMGFDISDDDPRSWVEMTLSFSTTQTNLAFSVLDIDTGSWDDGVLITYNGGTNVRANTNLWSYAQTNASLRTVVIDNETGFTGWEGDPTAAATNQNYGNVNLNFNGVSVNSITIRFFSTDDAENDPGSQKIGISDLYVVPEPPALLAGALIPLLLLLARRRMRR